MSFIYPISASVLQAASFTLDKITLSIKRVSYKTYLGISFPLIFFLDLIAFLVFKPQFSWDLFSTGAVSAYIAVVVLVIAGNFIFYRTLKHEKVSEIETLSLIGQISLIIYTGLIFPAERNFFIIFLALICSASVIWAHWKRGHLEIAKQTKLYLGWAVFIAPFAMILNSYLLKTWNPIVLELFRNGAVALVFGTMFFRYELNVSKKAVLLLIATNVVTTIAWILYFFSIQKLGVIQTVLVFSIQPLLVYFASIFLLKEKLHWKKFVSFLFILASIVLSRVIAA